ncbi:MAG: histidine kinase dimerization/phosphoacceptor domain -containing protein [Pseudomonadota bacterium]
MPTPPDYGNLAVMRVFGIVAGKRLIAGGRTFLCALFLIFATIGGCLLVPKTMAAPPTSVVGEVFDQDEIWDAINADPATGRAKAMAFINGDPPLSPDNKRRALNIIGVSFAMQGRMDEALVYAHQAVDMAMEQNDFVSASRGWTNIAQMEQARGGLEAAVEAYANAVELSKKADQEAVAHDHTLTSLGALLLEYGRPDDAIELLEQARPVLAADERPEDRASGFLPLAQAYQKVGRLDEAGSLFEEIRAFLNFQDNAELAAKFYCAEAEFLFATDKVSRSQTLAKQCLSVARKAELLFPQADALTVLGKAALSADEMQTAKAHLAELKASLDNAESAIASGRDVAPSVLRRRLEEARIAADIARREDRLEDALRLMTQSIAYDEMLDGIASRAGSALGTFQYRQEIDALNVQLLETEAIALQTRNAQQRQLIIGAFLLSALLALLAWLFFRGNREKRALNSALQRSLDSERLLNSDMQHRVRNNLQILLSMLNLQLRDASTESISTVQSVKNRVLSMAALYATLYSNDDADISSPIEAQEVLLDLIDSISDTYGARDRVGAIEIENVSLDKATASPLGLLVAELISNVFKHTESSFDLTLKSADPQRNVLTITDQGPSFSADTSLKSGGGLSIVYDLADQIDAVLTHRTSSPVGNQWVLEFPSQKVSKKT